MNSSRALSRYSPLVILGLLAALVLVCALWVMERAGPGAVTQRGATASTAYFHWKMVTTWPKNFPGLGLGPENFSRIVEAMSNGRLTVRVYGAGEVVPAFGVFDAVSRRVAEMGHGAAYYWTGKVPSSVFFTSVPFGFTAQEINAWIYYGGGLELWREAYAPFGLIPFPGGNSGVQMGGWFNREINSVEDLRGLKMRMPGIGGEILNRAGGTAVVLPGGELYTSLQTGVIDATEWVGPYNDLALGLHEVGRYYYYPGWQEPGAMLEFTINRDAWNELPSDLQAIVAHATRAVNQDMLDEFTARNNAALQTLINDHGVELRKFPDDVLRKLQLSATEVYAELAADDPMSAKVYPSFKAFLDQVAQYHRISEQAYINSRNLYQP